MRFSALLVKLSIGAMLAVVSSTAVFAHRIAFLTEQLKLKPLPAKVIDSIPELYQPPRQN